MVDPRISVKDGVAQFVAELRRKVKKGPQIDILEEEAGLGSMIAEAIRPDELR